MKRPSTDKQHRVDTKRMKFLDCVVAFDPKTITKSADGTLMIEGYANTVDKDRVGDVVLPVAFKESLPTYLSNPVLLYQHNWDAVIGKVIDAKIDLKGLWIKASISNAKDVEDVRVKIREAILQTFSIGYNEIESTFDEKTQTKVIRKLELLEISVVTIPANAAAKFAVSAAGGDPAPATAPAAAAPAVEPEKSFTILVSDKIARLIPDSTLLPQVAAFIASIHSSKGAKMKTKEQLATEAAAAALAAKADPAPAGAPDAGAPAAAAPDAAAEGAMDKDILAKLGEIMTFLTALGAKVDAMCAGMASEGGAAAPAAGEPAAAPAAEPGKAAAAPAVAAIKSLDEMTDEEALAELEKNTEQLEAIGASEGAA